MAFIGGINTSIEDLEKTTRQILNNDILHACIYLASFAIGVGLVTLMQKKYFQTLVRTLAEIEKPATSTELKV